MATNRRGRPRKDETRTVSLAAWVTEQEIVLLDDLLAEHDPYLTRSAIVQKWLHGYFKEHGYDARTLQRSGSNVTGGAERST